MKSLYEIVQSSLSAKDLILALDELIPTCHPNPSMTDREIWIRVGERNLVGRLVGILEQLEEEELE